MKHHRSGHRYKGTLMFLLEDGTVEKTVIEERYAKGYDNFMISVIQAVVEMTMVFSKATPMVGDNVKITYEGDFGDKVKFLLDRMVNIDKSTPLEREELRTLLTLYKAASEI